MVETRESVMQVMKCGHRANGTSGNRTCCVGCAMNGDDRAFEEETEVPDLSGRMAMCCYGEHGKVAASFNLAFFEQKPNDEFDRYYCGCFGWD